MLASNMGTVPTLAGEGIKAPLDWAHLVSMESPIASINDAYYRGRKVLTIQQIFIADKFCGDTPWTFCIPGLRRRASLFGL